jgi:hypothetical protein
MTRRFAIFAALLIFVVALITAASATTTRSVAVIYNYDRAAPNAQSALTSAQRAPVRAGTRTATHSAQQSGDARFTDFLAAESATGVASGLGGETASMSIVRTVGPGERVADLLNEGKALTFESGNEHALVRLANGERAIVSGGPGGIEFPQGAVSRVIPHTHPYGMGATAASAADFAMLDAYGQQSSWLLSEGVLSKFWAGG